MAATTTPSVVCLPIKLDAYMLNASACGTFPDATLAPLAQPNFTWLRLDSALMEPDVLPYHDLHNASPAANNPRVTDLGTGNPRVERQGVYLHWMLPRIYRSGSSQPTAEDRPGLQAPQFHYAPDRWLVLRRLHPGSFEPADVIANGQMRWVEAWVVESNRIRNITDDPEFLNDNLDIELECAPYVLGDDATAPLDAQAEIFIGAKKNVVDDNWQEQRPANPDKFVPLNVVGASNPLFADYTAHNPNVFSILDNFSYKATDSGVGYLTKATASYCVLGWHSMQGEDTLYNLGKNTLAQMFRQCFLQLMSQDGADLSQPARALCHGAMYSVQYASEGAAGITVPINDVGHKLADNTSHPVTVGTTPLDAILAYIAAHSGSLTQTETDILHLDTLLLKQDDDADNQQEALDMLSAHNFKPAKDSGSHYHFVAAQGANPLSGGAAPPPTKTQAAFQPTLLQQQQLAALNAAQSALDGASRELRAARWELFALWWNYCSTDTLMSNTQNQVQTVQKLQAAVTALTSAVAAALVPLQNPSSAASAGAASNSMVQGGSQSPFYVQSDPTILVPGISNPWPSDWLDPNGLKVRMNTQVQPAALPATMPDGWLNLPDLVNQQIPQRLPSSIQAAAALLVTEFYDLDPTVGGSTSLPPLYHDGRDTWNSTQPFFPLFLEYEVRYYHLDYSLWDFGTTDDAIPGSAPKIRYHLNENSKVLGMTGDERVILGRILVLPQPGFSLSKSIERLLLGTPSDELPDDLQTPTAQQQLVDNAAQLQYLSAPMAGFMDHLVTKLNGIHIKPSIRVPGKVLQPLAAAITAGQQGGFDTGDKISLMDIETTKTPYGDYVAFPDPKIDPLKPVTHGQFKFKRLSIIDKFGQAIDALNPAPQAQSPVLYPALSEYFHPQPDKSSPSHSMTVVDDGPNNCQFGQYPPTINQEARINASFLHYDNQDPSLGGPTWRPCTEWENPIWGFLVVNYAEYAIQVFLPDGTFYREVRLGGPSGTSESPAWRPFPPPAGSNGKQVEQFPQLDKLITQLKGSDGAYVRAIFDMVDGAIQSVAHTPSQYASFLNAIVGRPLALANIGLSLELAAPPLQSQSTTSQFPPATTPALLGYTFPLKVGDADRSFDGLVGYYPSRPGAMTGGSTALGDELVLDSVLTYWPSPGAAATTAIAHANYPVRSPYFLSTANLDVQTAGSATAAAVALQKQHWAQMLMLGLLVDPFTAVHVYSGILPVASVQLPAWTLQSAMRQMTAFFTAGPLIVTDGSALVYDPDGNLENAAGETGVVARFVKAAAGKGKGREKAVVVKGLAKGKEVATNKPDAKGSQTAGGGATPGPGDGSSAKVGDPTPPATAAPPPGLALPAIKQADWNWLAPFAIPSPDGTGGGAGNGTGDNAGSRASTTATKSTEWNAIQINTLDNGPKYEKGPYVAIEGFMQLQHPITSPDTM